MDGGAHTMPEHLVGGSERWPVAHGQYGINSSWRFQFDHEEEDRDVMRTPGVEPGSQAWEACMMPLHYVRL